MTALTAIRWTRRALDAVLAAAILVVLVTAAITVLAPTLGRRPLAIGGGSMQPAIPRGALVVAMPAETPYAVGDVVTVVQGSAAPFTRRITRLAELNGVPYVETKGDANLQPDPVIVPASAIVGRVVLVVPLLGYLSSVLGTGLGLAGFLALCAAALLLIWLLDDLAIERCPICAESVAAECAAAALVASAISGSAATPGESLHPLVAGAATAPVVGRDRRRSNRLRLPDVPAVREASPLEEEPADPNPDRDAGGDVAA